MHSRDHADSQYVIHVGVYCKGAEFIGNKHSRSLVESHTQLYKCVTKIALPQSPTFNFVNKSIKTNRIWSTTSRVTFHQKIINLPLCI